MGSAKTSSLETEAELGLRDPLRVSPALALRRASQHSCFTNVCAGVPYEQPACKKYPRCGVPFQPGYLGLDVGLDTAEGGWPACSSGMTADSVTACLH